MWFDDGEAKAIAEFLGVTEAHFRRYYARKFNGRWTLEERAAATGGGYDCVFLDRDEQGKPACRIYPVRPKQCRTWPFWPENLVSERAWRRAAQTCPGMAVGLCGEGRLHKVAEIHALRDRTPEDE